VRFQLASRPLQNSDIVQRIMQQAGSRVAPTPLQPASFSDPIEFRQPRRAEALLRSPRISYVCFAFLRHPILEAPSPPRRGFTFLVEPEPEWTEWEHMANSSLERSPIHLLHRATQSADSVFDAKIGDLTTRQLAVLEAVVVNEGANQAVLGQVTGIDRATAAGLVKRLIRKGLLQRRRTAADARAYAVTLTDEGRRVLRKLGPVVKAVDKHVLASLPEARREPFLSSLRSVIATLGKSPAQR
jgi:MarR family transcriptional regulator, temperature-dependent positive regulator of motility